MKRILIFIIALFAVSSVFSQTISERIATKVCESLSEIDTYEVLVDSINVCVPKAMEFVKSNCSWLEKGEFNETWRREQIVEEVYILLPKFSSNVKKLIDQEEKRKNEAILAKSKLEDSSKTKAIAKKRKPKKHSSSNTISGNKRAKKQSIKKVHRALPKCNTNIRIVSPKISVSNDMKSHIATRAIELFDKAEIFVSEGDEINAIGYYRRAIKFDDEFVVAYDRLAASLVRSGEMRKAINVYKESLSVFPTNNFALLKIAELYSAVGKPYEALKYYEKLKDIDEHCLEAYLGCANILYVDQEYEAALKNLFEAQHMYDSSNISSQKNCDRLFRYVSSSLNSKGQSYLVKRVARKYK